MTPRSQPTTANAATPSHSPLLVHQRDGVCWLRLNRPTRRNALNPQLVAALDQGIRRAERDSQTEVIVIAGEGPSFCAGADLQHLHELATAGRSPTRFLSAVSACFTRIEQIPKPVVAAVHGHAVAGGLELALACDVVVGQAGTLLGDGHLRNGLLPGGGASVQLPRKVGEPLARWLMLTGEFLPVEAFTATGFVHAVASADRFPTLIDKTVAQLRGSAVSAQQRLKRLLHESRDLDATEALAHELSTFDDHWNSDEIAAFLRRFLNGVRPTSSVPEQGRTRTPQDGEDDPQTQP